MPTTAVKESTVTVEAIDNASKHIYEAAVKTPLEYSKRLSERYHAIIYLKREDQQIVRSYKIRGAYNLLRGLDAMQRLKPIVTASAGNHAQGVAYAVARLGLEAIIYVPTNTPLQKVQRIKFFGGNNVEIRFIGTTFDDSLSAAQNYSSEVDGVFVHPFNDLQVIIGQGTVGKEILEQISVKPEVIILPIGGGGLLSGLGTYVKALHPATEIIGVEPDGAPAMQQSLGAGYCVKLSHINKFVDGAAVQSVGINTLEIARNLVKRIVTVPEGKTCTTMIELYQNEGIITEPAGALAASSLDILAKDIYGKNVVVVISGGNNDIHRYPDIIERSEAYERSNLSSIPS